MISAPLRPSPSSFTLLSAVDTWDSEYRWREGGQLHDLTIEDTWARVGHWLSRAESNPAEWAKRFVAAFAHWQLLPDERLLRHAGSSVAPTFDLPPLALVNASAHVVDLHHRKVRMDHAGIAATAALAVRVLDDALLLVERPPQQSIRIGLIGVADALDRLGTGFDSPAALSTASELAQALLQGCVQGAMDLSIERGAGLPPSTTQLDRWRDAGLDPGLLAAASRNGLRRPLCVGSYAAARLARLANSLAEGSDPTQPLHPGQHPTASVTWPPLAAQLRLRAVLGRCFDAPIDQPLLVERAPSEANWREVLSMAAQLGLPAPRWRLVVPEPGFRD